MTRDRSRKIYNFESRLFKLQLVGLLPLWFYLTFWVQDIERSKEQPYVAGGLLLLSIIMLYAVRYDRFLKQMIAAYAMISVMAFGYYWVLFGGYNGPMAYAYFTFIAIFVALLPSKYRVFFALIFSTFVAVMTIHQEYVSPSGVNEEPVGQFTLQASYFVCSVVLAVVLIFLKRNFDSGRALIIKNNKRLSSLNKRVESRQKELMNQREEIRSIKDNLELLIQKRTFELETKTKKLEKYAYDNAHHVRKPISNILGLLNVMEIEKEKLQIDPEKLNKVKQNAEDLDSITQKINAILK